MGDFKLFNNIQRIDTLSSDFPDRLRHIPDPPGQIYCTGDLSLLNADSVSVVGSRRYTVYGKAVAMMIGRRLGECGIPVVSGLAYGIDAFSHEGALEAGGRTIGVLASGILKMGPRKNHELMMRGLKNGGLVVSEYPPEQEAAKYTFPQRNRIISALGMCLVVVEANFNSGALITAQHASEQGRQVYAVPGNINSQFSAGSNFLIRDGAIPLVVIDDLIRDLGVDLAASMERRTELGDDENLIYTSVSRHEGASIDTVSRETGLSTGLISSIVTVLEIKGIVETYGGKIYLAK
ncbi:MAG: DNA-processing protein DprA [Mogibacterium sp.]|nr:DNA-processing protein DprA [Mogibacterium sp.]